MVNEKLHKMSKEQISQWIDEKTPEIIAFVFKSLVWLTWIMLGFITNLSYKILKGKKIIWWQTLGCLGVTIFVGFIVGKLCTAYHIDSGKSGIIISICALSSEKIINIVMSWSWKKTINRLIEIYLGSNGKP